MGSRLQSIPVCVYAVDPKKHHRKDIFQRKHFERNDVQVCRHIGLMFYVGISLPPIWQHGGLQWIVYVFVATTHAAMRGQKSREGKRTKTFTDEFYLKTIQTKRNGKEANQRNR